MRVGEIIGMILEERRNPQLNPRVDALSAFSMYKNKPNMFVTYTDIPKIGVNPRSSWQTPLGIYSYPLDYILSDAYTRGSVYGAAPFAAEAKYVQLFQQTGRIIDASDPMNGEDYEKIADYIDVTFNSGASPLQPPRTFGDLWRFAYGVLKMEQLSNEALYARKIFHDTLGYDAITDLFGTGTIHPSEPTQAVHFTTRTIKPVDIFENKSPHVTKASPFFDDIQKIADNIQYTMRSINDDSTHLQYIISDIKAQQPAEKQDVEPVLKDVTEFMRLVGILLMKLDKGETIPGGNMAFQAAHRRIFEQPTVRDYDRKRWARMVAIYAESIDRRIYGMFDSIIDIFIGLPNPSEYIDTPIPNWRVIQRVKREFDQNFSEANIRRMNQMVRDKIL